MFAFAIAEKPTDLEDIERDTLLSEQRNNSNGKESLTTDQTQHLRPPINAASSSPYEVRITFIAYVIHLFFVVSFSISLNNGIPWSLFQFLRQKTDGPTGNDVVDDIAYAPQTNNGVDEYDSQQQIQYVTPQQYEEVKHGKFGLGAENSFVIWEFLHSGI